MRSRNEEHSAPYSNSIVNLNLSFVLCILYVRIVKNEKIRRDPLKGEVNLIMF
jgi:hypothetical protein